MIKPELKVIHSFLSSESNGCEGEVEYCVHYPAVVNSVNVYEPTGWSTLSLACDVSMPRCKIWRER